MSQAELMKLRHSDEAPFNHAEYTVWLHNKIVAKINYELWQFREQRAMQISSSYAACNAIMKLESLQPVK